MAEVRSKLDEKSTASSRSRQCNVSEPKELIFLRVSPCQLFGLAHFIPRGVLKARATNSTAGCRVQSSSSAGEARCPIDRLGRHPGKENATPPSPISSSSNNMQPPGRRIPEHLSKTTCLRYRSVTGSAVSNRSTRKVSQREKCHSRFSQQRVLVCARRRREKP